MSPIEAPGPQFNFAPPPPGFFRDPVPFSGSSPSSPTEQDPMLIHRLDNISRAKLNNLFRSRKDNGLLKHVLIHNLSRSCEELTPELVAEEREDGYEEIMVEHRTAEELWLDACFQGLVDDDEEDREVDDQDDDDDDDEAMYDAAARFYYATTSSEEDLAMTSPPALSPDMSLMDDSDLSLSGHNSPKDFYYDEEEEDERTLPPLSHMDYEHDRSAYIDYAKHELAPILQPVPTTGEPYQDINMRFLQTQRKRGLNWTEVDAFYY